MHVVSIPAIVVVSTSSGVPPDDQSINQFIMSTYKCKLTIKRISVESQLGAKKKKAFLYSVFSTLSPPMRDALLYISSKIATIHSSVTAQ